MIEIWIILLAGVLFFFGLLVSYKRGSMQRLPTWTGLGYGKDSQLDLEGYEKVQIADETQGAEPKKRIVTHEFQGKTLWDWLQLLIIPVVLASVALLFNARQESMNQQLAQQSKQEQVVDAYLDRMANLLLV